MSDARVNKDFIIRVYPSQSGIGNNSLLSAQTMRTLVGDHLAGVLIDMAYRRGTDMVVCKPRRESITKIEFVSK